MMCVMKRLVVLSFIIGSIAVLVTGVRYSVDRPGIAVKVETVKRESIRSSILASGKLIYLEEVELGSQLFGKVSKVLIEESDVVKRDQVVLRIDPQNFEAELEQYQAALQQRRIALERVTLRIGQLERKLKNQQVLYERQFLGKDAYEDALSELSLARLERNAEQAGIAQAKAQVDQARDKLEKTVIRAPMAGIVTAVEVKAGESVIAGATGVHGSVLMRIADPTEVLTEVHVDEADIVKIQVGQEADVHVVAFPDDPFRGRIRSIASIATKSRDGGTQGFTVKIVLPDAGRRSVRPGISCRAEIFYDSKPNAISIPLSAVVFDDLSTGKSNESTGDSYVFVAHEGVAKRRKVRLGISNDTHQEILDGLTPGEKLIIGPYRTLKQLKDDSAIVVEDDKTRVAQS
jgi:HlyD family secretion protein